MLALDPWRFNPSSGPMSGRDASVLSQLINRSTLQVAILVELQVLYLYIRTLSLWISIYRYSELYQPTSQPTGAPMLLLVKCRMYVKFIWKFSVQMLVHEVELLPLFQHRECKYRYILCTVILSYCPVFLPYVP